MTEPTDAELLAEWDRVSHIADAGQRRLACLRAVLAKWGTLCAEKIVIPTDTMEQEFQTQYLRGFAAGKKANQPAHGGEPVGEVVWAAGVPNSIREVHLKKQGLPIGTKLYNTPQAIPGVQWQCGPQANGFTAPQAATTTQADSAQNELISREEWVERAMRVYLIAGDTEDEARECAEYQWGELDMDDIPDPYFTAMEDIEVRGPAPQADSQPAPAAVAEPVAFTAEHVTYIRRYGGSCRDCADENGVCPNRGLPCADSEKAIRFVLEALAYGINHGYIAAPTTQPAPQPSPALQVDALDAEQHEMDARHAAIYRWMLIHVADVLSIFDNWLADGEADTDELHDALAASAAQECNSHGLKT